MSKHSGWCFTINNYTEEDVDAVKTVNCAAMKAGFEIAPSGTPHIQGAVYWVSAVSMRTAIRRLGGRASVRAMRGTWKDQDYCLKDGDILRNDGVGPQQGRRTDLELAAQAIEEGASALTMYRDHGSVMARYSRYVGGYKAALMEELSLEFRHVEVHIIWGEAGKNKTRSVLYDDQDRRNPDVYVVPMSKDLKWWDGYRGQKTILMDEFAEGDDDNISFKRWKRLCDGHQMYLETKGGHTYAMWTTVYMCSNLDPAQWWGGMYFNNAEFTRRITSIKKV